MDLMEKINTKIKEWQTNGIPLFMIRDESKKAPSVSLTMLVVSFTLAILSLINKFAKIVDGMDVDNTLELLMITSSLYFGRSLSKKMQKPEDGSKEE